jgi:hypothetical protein
LALHLPTGRIKSGYPRNIRCEAHTVTAFTTKHTITERHIFARKSSIRINRVMLLLRVICMHSSCTTYDVCKFLQIILHIRPYLLPSIIHILGLWILLMHRITMDSLFDCWQRMETNHQNILNN